MWHRKRSLQRAKLFRCHLQWSSSPAPKDVKLLCVAQCSMAASVRSSTMRSRQINSAKRQSSSLTMHAQAGKAGLYLQSVRTPCLECSRRSWIRSNRPVHQHHPMHHPTLTGNRLAQIHQQQRQIRCNVARRSHKRSIPTEPYSRRRLRNHVTPIPGMHHAPPQARLQQF